MSHDTDKLIRQLSLVAFLMAERRALTAREIKSSVEGYQEMSDEAFARRFYSDRAELQALGVPLHSQRDEYTGEELYTMRSERYFLPPLELTDEELAALQTCLYLLEGRFAYAEPLRLAAESDGHDEEAIERPAAPVAPERFAVLQALLAYLLDRCGENAEAVIPADELVERFHIPPDELEEHLSLLNLVNF